MLTAKELKNLSFELHGDKIFNHLGWKICNNTKSLRLKTLIKKSQMLSLHFGISIGKDNAHL